MGKASLIEYATSSFSPWEGCTEYGPGCEGCYARASNNRWHGGENWGKGAPRIFRSDKFWREPFDWNKEAEITGQPWRVFSGPVCDVFDGEHYQESEVPYRSLANQRVRLFELIKRTPHLTWMLFTKRIGLVLEEDMLPADWGPNGYPNVWLIATMVSQKEVDRDGPKLLQVPAAKHGISLEPLLERVDLRALLAMRITPDIIDRAALDGNKIIVKNEVLGKPSRVDWLIPGGESWQTQHPNPRPYHLEWPGIIIDQGRAAGVAVYHKQIGDNPMMLNEAGHLTAVRKRANRGALMQEWPRDLQVREFPT